MVAAAGPYCAKIDPVPARPKPQEPKTREEWQDAVDAAAAARAIEDCRMYGLITGGPAVNVARCDDLLKRGRARGVVPSAPICDLAVAFVANWFQSTARGKAETATPIVGGVATRVNR